MKLLDKLKNALFEEEEEQEETEEIIRERPVSRVTEKEEVAEKPEYSYSRVSQPVKKVEPIITEEEPKEEIPISTLEYAKEEKKKGPIIFDDEDFLSDTKEMSYQQVPKKEEKILYGGYDGKEKDHAKEKFKPSPVISPVYGFISKKEPEYESNAKPKNLDHLFVDERKKTVSFDSIRNKAYGNQLYTYDEENKKDEPKQDISLDDSNLFYEMQEVDDKPGIEKITLGDAEEYYEDLGLEYEVDYKDALKDRMTRTKKNQDLSEILEEEIKEEEKIKSEYKSSPKDDFIEAEEKNLYDLIDMMYDSKE